MIKKEGKKSRLQFLIFKTFTKSKLGGRVPSGHFPTR